MPLVVALCLAFFITDILYSEGKRNSLAGAAEKWLIEQTLSRTLWNVPDDIPVVAISLSPTDESKGLVFSDPTGLRDASLVTYARLLERVFSANPRFTVVSWLPAAHKPEDANALTNLLAQNLPAEDVVIGYPIAEIGSLPVELRDLGVVREGEDCVYQVNSFCSVNSAWKTWLIQNLVERFWPSPPSGHISTNLPHVLPNFLLNLPRRGSIEQVDFAAVLEGTAPSFQDKIVFIGNSLEQPDPMGDNKELVRRTLSVENRKADDVAKQGTPLHVYWAQIVAMFLADRTVAIPTRSITRALMLTLCASIILLMWRVGPGFTFGLFLIFGALFPLINMAMVRFAHLYVPAFEILYGGSLTFLFATFGQLSISRYRSWNLDARRKLFETTADLKSNFISLISHNLNTPIAKLQGLLDVIIQSNPESQASADLRKAQELVIKQRLLVKAILMSTTVEQQGVGRTRCTLRDLVTEFEETMRGVIQRLGLSMRVNSVSGEQVDLYLDRALVSQALATLCALLRSETTSRNNRAPLEVLLDFAAVEQVPGEPSLTVRAFGLTPSQEVRDLVASLGGSRHSRDLESPYFYRELMVKFIHLVATHYHGSLETRRDAGGESLYLHLAPGFAKAESPSLPQL